MFTIIRVTHLKYCSVVYYACELSAHITCSNQQRTLKHSIRARSWMSIDGSSAAATQPVAWLTRRCFVQCTQRLRSTTYMVPYDDHTPHLTGNDCQHLPFCRSDKRQNVKTCHTTIRVDLHRKILVFRGCLVHAYNKSHKIKQNKSLSIQTCYEHTGVFYFEPFHNPYKPRSSRGAYLTYFLWAPTRKKNSTFKSLPLLTTHIHSASTLVRDTKVISYYKDLL